MKTALENYLDGAALDESLEKHDAQYHDGHFDPQTMSCGKRDQLAKGDDPKLDGGETGEKSEVSAGKGVEGGGDGDEKAPEGTRISQYLGDLGDGELDAFYGDLGRKLKGIKFDRIELGEIDETGDGSLTYETPMASSASEVEEDGGEWVVKTRIEPTFGARDAEKDAGKIDDALKDVGLGSYVFTPELKRLSSEDETGLRTAKMASDFQIVVRDNEKFWKYVKGFRKSGAEAAA